VVGTAGHIDHGKSAIVEALTGVHPDRLVEEQRRGITIELGFADLELPPEGVVGFVDVPGHERFVRHMVAGATGFDAAMLVIAADDGVKPQTREHLAIMSLLGLAHGFVVLSASAEVLYKATDYWYPEHERTLLWNDPALRIDWPLPGAPTLAAKDAAGRLFADADVYA